MDEELMTVEQVAALLKMNADSVRRLARGGRIPAVKVGGRAWRFPRSLMESYLRGEWTPKPKEAQ